VSEDMVVKERVGATIAVENRHGARFMACGDDGSAFV
jgi:hypothetical protein